MRVKRIDLRQGGIDLTLPGTAGELAARVLREVAPRVAGREELAAGQLVDREVKESLARWEKILGRRPPGMRGAVECPEGGQPRIRVYVDAAEAEPL